MDGTDHAKYMRRAIALARKNALEDGFGGPFGCVIVKDGTVIAEGVNEVIARKDPSCHGEVMAIRAACAYLDTHILSGCVLYTSGEPCPMCYAASWWARVDAIYYASTVADAKTYGDFDDVPIFDALKVPGPVRPLPSRELLRDEMIPVWQAFRAMPDRLHY